MKNLRRITSLLLLVTLLSACAPVTATPPPTTTEAANGVPTSTKALTTTATPPLELLPTTMQSVDKFTNALKNVGVDITPEQIHAQGLKIYTLTAKNGTPFKISAVFIDPDSSQTGELLEGNYPLMIETAEGWDPATLADFSRIANMDIVSRASMNEKAEIDTLTSIKMEIGDTESLFYSDFNWSQVVENWDEVYKQLIEGKLPFDEDLFNPSVVNNINGQIEEAKVHNMRFVGDVLFPLSFSQDPATRDLSPEDQIKIIFYKGAAKLIKFPEITEIDLEAEITATQIWQDPSYFQIPFEKLGGSKFLADYAKFIKQVKPSIKLNITEDNILIDEKTSANSDNELLNHRIEFMALLKDLRSFDAPIEGVKLENAFWTHSYPSEGDVINTLQEIQSLGYEISAPDMIVCPGKVSPLYEGWTETVPLNPGETEDQRRMEIYATVFKGYLNAGAISFGFHSLTDGEGWLGDNCNIYDNNGMPKMDYYVLLKELFEFIKN